MSPAAFSPSLLADRAAACAQQQQGFCKLLLPPLRRLHLCFQIGSRSSVYSPESSVRKTGSYIYEEFMPTDGTDVKVRAGLGWEVSATSGC